MLFSAEKILGWCLSCLQRLHSPDVGCTTITGKPFKQVVHLYKKQINYQLLHAFFENFVCLRLPSFDGRFSSCFGYWKKLILDVVEIEKERLQQQ